MLVLLELVVLRDLCVVLMAPLLPYTTQAPEKLLHAPPFDTVVVAREVVVAVTMGFVSEVVA